MIQSYSIWLKNLGLYTETFVAHNWEILFGVAHCIPFHNIFLYASFTP